MLLQQPQAGAHDIARGAVAAIGNPPLDEIREVIADGDGGIF